MLNIKGLSPDQAELVKSLQELEVSDEEIMKSLNITPEEETTDKIEKSVDEQIAEKQIELDRLNQLQDLEKSNNGVFDYDEKFDEINKSLTASQNQIKESNDKSDERMEGLTNLIKSLTDTMVSIKDDNEKLLKDNDDLKKSFEGSEEILKALANYSPGLKSINGMSGAGQVQRFEKSTTDDGMNVLSISQHKGEISSRLTKYMEGDEEFAKSLTDDIASLECSSKVSPRLEKALAEKLSIKVVA